MLTQWFVSPAGSLMPEMSQLKSQTKCVHERDGLVGLPPGDHPRRRTFQTRADEAHLIL
ncbi:hypothetical protein LOAG_18992 [Loa loa]|uniref:Uncharacterized protein n=1 Tax=Loa loa TaxID=7209 RepID=A0A1S0UD63_LOALO|nr:hypothetical protein LOAG_18992 [Loa loa]EJD73592.1 hypothetical protein LOAG_18992 [Loa loa]